ncbi:hypothetical protein D3C76_1589830 [compost metagenome]
MLFVTRPLQREPVFIGCLRLRSLTALAYGALNDGRPHRRHVEADAFLEEVEKPLITAHDRPSSSARSSGGDGNSSART